MTILSCAVDGCGKTKIHAKGFCYGHYMKAWRYGTPAPEHARRYPDLVTKRFGTLVVLERVGEHWRCLCDCGKERLALAGDLNRTPDSASCGDRTEHWREDVCGYGALHERLSRDYGAARTLSCVDCGMQARHWSYDHGDPDELTEYLSDQECEVAYSMKPEHYQPRCVSCHKRFDLDKINAARHNLAV